MALFEIFRINMYQYVSIFGSDLTQVHWCFALPLDKTMMKGPLITTLSMPGPFFIYFFRPLPLRHPESATARTIKASKLTK